MKRGAVISPCGQYRYALWRTWRPGPYVAFIGLNPSTADAEVDDPTIRRCIAFAQSWGYGGLAMVNLFAFRATRPEDMLAAVDPVGPENDDYLHAATGLADKIVAAWGTRGGHRGRGAEIRRKFAGRLHVLRVTKHGHPEHPLYLPATLTPRPYP